MTMIKPSAGVGGAKNAFTSSKASRPARYTGAGHRGVTHVRGKDCVHADIGRVVVKDDLFSCPGERTTGAEGRAPSDGRERSSS